LPGIGQFDPSDFSFQQFVKPVPVAGGFNRNCNRSRQTLEIANDCCLVIVVQAAFTDDLTLVVERDDLAEALV
jgi:hypothetical protein